MVDNLSIFDLPDEERYVFSTESGTINAQRIIGDPQIHENTSEVYKYTCEFGLLMEIVDNVVNNVDSSDVMHKFLGAPGHLTLCEGESRDINGYVYNRLESAILETERFDGYVEPSTGTVWRLKKFKQNDVGDKYEFNAYFICPEGYPNCDKEDREGYDKRKAEIQRECFRAGFKFVCVDSSWRKMPRFKRLYFGALGWKMHEYDVNGMGLELNPDVAAILKLAMIKCEVNADHRLVTYVRNNWMHEMKYYDVPHYYRIHGIDYSKQHDKVYDTTNSLFNVVNTEFDKYMRQVVVTDDYTFAHCSRRVIAPAIIGYKIEIYEGVTYKLALCNSVNPYEVVDLISPGYELSTRTVLLGMLGYRRAMYNEMNSFVVLSSIASKFVNMYTDEGKLKLDTRKYACEVYNFPSAWFYNGTNWILRAYPNAIRFRKWLKGDAMSNVQDDRGHFLVPDHRGQWYLQGETNAYYLLEYDKRVLNDDLLFGTSIKRKGNRKRRASVVSSDPNVDMSIDNHRIPQFYLSGEVTKLYYPSDNGYPMVVKERSIRILNEHSITINYKKDVNGGDMLVTGHQTSLMINRYTDACVYHFHSVKEANTFYLENKKSFSNNIWKGDLRKPYQFCDPSSGHKILVPRAKFLLDGSLFSMPLEASDVMMHDDAYDQVGNFFIESAGQNVYEVFDNDDLNG
jgi:hypothetical protein